MRTAKNWRLLGQGLAILTLSAALAACGGSTDSSGPSSSASGTMIPWATQIVDSALNVWTVTGGVVYEGGKTAGYSANVALLLYYGGTLYQENKSCLWWSWNGSAWVASSNPAPKATPACSAAAAPPVYPPTTTSTSQPPLITLARPGYLQPTALPGMGTSVMRMSDATTFGIGQRYYRHYYSKQQPWNSDSTRLMLSVDARRVYFLDGKTFAYLWTATNVPDYT